MTTAGASGPEDANGRHRVGVDVGGTFTDLICITPDGEVILDKTPTTPHDQSEGVVNGLGLLAGTVGSDLAGFCGSLEAFVHGTTTADNTMIEMSGATTGLLTTEGHRDEIELRRDHKEEIWDPTYPPPVPIARRRARIPIPERLDFEGNEILALDEEAVRRGVRRLRKLGVDSIAVCFLFSFVNPEHELRAGALIAEEYPDVEHVSLSHEVLPRAPEFERTSTTLVNAYVAPRITAYVGRLVERLHQAGFDGQVVLMQSSGGVMPPESVARRAVSLLGSGPTGGVMAAALAAERSGVTEFVAADMGGTSYDVCLVQGSAPAVATDWNWRHRYYLNIPMVDIHSVGAGGGSIARVRQGALLVGPDSAGSHPGPVCYGRGGTDPTVTDADAVLGYLPAKGFAGGTHGARRRVGPAGHRARHRRAHGPRRRRRRLVGPAHRQCQHGQRRAQGALLPRCGPADPGPDRLRRRRARPRLGPGPRAGHPPGARPQGLARLLGPRAPRVRLRGRPDAGLRGQAFRRRRGAGALPGGRTAPGGRRRAGPGPARAGQGGGQPVRPDVLPRPELRHERADPRGRGS